MLVVGPTSVYCCLVACAARTRVAITAIGFMHACGGSIQKAAMGVRCYHMPCMAWQ